MAWASKARGHERTLRIVFGFAMAATGIGSFVFHGFDSAVAQFLHDITFLVTIWLLAVINVSEVRGWSRRVGWGVVGMGIVLFSVFLIIVPQATNILTFLVTLALVLADVTLRRSGASRSWWYWAALVSIVIAVLAFILGRSAGPLCDPDSLIQGHALWHLLSASAITAYFVATSEARIAGEDLI